MQHAGLISSKDNRFGITSVPRVDVELNTSLSFSPLCADIALFVCQILVCWVLLFAK